MKNISFWSTELFDNNYLYQKWQESPCHSLSLFSLEKFEKRNCARTPAVGRDCQYLLSFTSTAATTKLHVTFNTSPYTYTTKHLTKFANLGMAWPWSLYKPRLQFWVCPLCAFSHFSSVEQCFISVAGCENSNIY